MNSLSIPNTPTSECKWKADARARYRSILDSELARWEKADPTYKVIVDFLDDRLTIQPPDYFITVRVGTRGIFRPLECHLGNIIDRYCLKRRAHYLEYHERSSLLLIPEGDQHLHGFLTLPKPRDGELSPPGDRYLSQELTRVSRMKFGSDVWRNGTKIRIPAQVTIHLERVQDVYCRRMLVYALKSRHSMKHWAEHIANGPWYSGKG